MIESAAAETAPAYKLAQFRTIAGNKPPVIAEGTPVRLLMDDDFAPFSFISTTGAPTGLAVELALAACKQVKLACTPVPLHYADLLPALEHGDGEVIIAGPRIDAANLERAVMTRAWFRFMGRFAVQSGNPLAAADPQSLAGKRIGVVKDTTHALWLQAYYTGSEIVPFDDRAKAGEALRTGNVAAIFGDNLQIIYWVAGEASRGCCKLLGGAYSDTDYFGRNMAFLVRIGRPDLRAAFDYGLDAVQKDGTTEKLFNAYVPLDPW